MLSLAISPCPNDTFAFHHLLASGEYDVTFLDIEELNAAALAGTFDIVKLSVAAFGLVRERYGLLHSGGAAGFGVGPLVVARTQRPVGGRIAIPGRRTTAALLLGLLGTFETVEIRFDKIAAAVAAGDADCGLLIHEGRFTYADAGLVKLADLGEVWEARMPGPLPLGAVAMRRSLGAIRAQEMDTRLQASVAAAQANPAASAAFVQAHAQEMDPAVQRRHIELYVNNYTLAADPEALATLLRAGQDQELYPASALPLFAW